MVGKKKIKKKEIESLKLDPTQVILNTTNSIIFDPVTAHTNDFIENICRQFVDKFKNYVVIDTTEYLVTITKHKEPKTINFKSDHTLVPNKKT